MKLHAPYLLALALPLAIAAAAPAVIIDSGDGTGNTSAPSPDPGWGNVGWRGVSVVYLGSGWVLTANHVGPGDVEFGGVVYPWVSGSDVRLSNPDDSLADLVMFRLYPTYPPLSDLSIRADTPSLGTALVLIGHGRDRGAATSWDPGPGPPIDGYSWGSGFTMRWGTNSVQVPSLFSPAFDTHVFGTVFDESGGGHTAHEAQGALGDSGGAAFDSNGDLAGILIGIGTYQNQPAQTALYGNETYAADLSIYRDEIVEIMPEPAGGLLAGAALLVVLTRARRLGSRT